MKISTNRVRAIIKEELQRALQEQLDHEGIRDVITTCSKLMSALNDFETNATGQMAHAVTSHLQKLEGLLEDMVSNPSSYIDPNQEQLAAKDEAAPVQSDVKVAPKTEDDSVIGEVPANVAG